MIRLSSALRAWGTSDFDDVFRQELMKLNIDQLPLQKAISMGNYVIDAPITVMNINAAETAGAVRVRAGIFFQTVIAGCNCADDPTPASSINEYCEIQLDIDKSTSTASVNLVG